uniref:Uncharacterized protein n=1 Tax=mine drainage metagenome TaxID=410659 RepID=E6QIE4_9ZZZZ
MQNKRQVKEGCNGTHDGNPKQSRQNQSLLQRPNRRLCRVTVFRCRINSEQFHHQYLIGCGDGDFNGGAWNCVDLRTGFYRVVAHNTTITILDSGWVESNLKTGKSVASIVPVFSVLARLN